MSRFFCILAAVCVAVHAAPPSPHSPSRLYQQAPAHLQNIHPLDYFMDNSDVAAYYNQAQQKQDERAPARLESLEPDSEVELIPGAQQPQQPPQQNPAAPNVPGLVPGQRGVFIVHMPIPGYRPGTIGGYQPIYIVAAAPQGNTAYVANGIPVGTGYQGVQGIQGVQAVQGGRQVPGGYQNTILVNPAAGPGQLPYFGYQGVQPQYSQQAGLLFGQVQGPVGFRGLEPIYQQQVDPAFAYQQLAGQQPVEGPQGNAVHLSQLIGLQGQQPHPAHSQQTQEARQNSEVKQRVGEASETVESKESASDEPRRNPRPQSTIAQRNNKV